LGLAAGFEQAFRKKHPHKKLHKKRLDLITLINYDL